MLETLRREAETAASKGPGAHASALANLAVALSQHSDERASETLAQAFSVASAEPNLEAELRLHLGEIFAGAGALELAAQALQACSVSADSVEAVRLEDLKDEVALRLAGGSEEPAARLTRKLFGRPEGGTGRAPSKARVLMASHGEVTTADAFDKKGKPARGGPRCVRIFGPTHSYACACGRYSGPAAEGVVCERCEVEVVDSAVRAQRHGHVVLGARVLHPWFFGEAATLLELGPERLVEVLDRDGADALAGQLTRSGKGELVLEVLPVPPPDGPVPGGRSTHERLELALGDLLAASKQARVKSNEVSRAALRRAVTAWLSCF